MNIWTAFFLVVSVVILASPLLFLKENRKVMDNEMGSYDSGGQVAEDGELELDLASGRLSERDLKTPTGERSEPLFQPVQRDTKGENGTLS